MGDLLGPERYMVNAAVQASAMNCREESQHITELFFNRMRAGIKGDSCMIHSVNHLSVYNSYFIIVCPFLDKLIGTAVKEPDCLSTHHPPTPLLCCSLILSGSCWDRGEIP